MFKKAFQIAISFGVLLGAYVGYVRLFAFVAEHALDGKETVAPLVATTSRTMKEAIALAEMTFGHEHWSADHNLPVRYYNKERGYWMYAQSYERLNEGRQLRFKPFAVIIQSPDKKDLKTITSDEAIVDLDRPLGMSVKPGGAPMHVIHAQITGDVRIRDDKGTRDAVDDLVIGPMPYLEYDEPTLQVRSDSDVVIQDRQMWVNGYGMLIQLRPKDETESGATPAGFDGAKTFFLKRKVHIILNDVGRSGMLPGKAQPEQTADGRTPMDLRCDSEMQIDLPKPRLPLRVGPPPPPDPTLALFSINVVVLRGKPNQTPDQLNCDHLRLTLLPGEKADPPTPAPTPLAHEPGTEPDPVTVSVGESAAKPAAVAPDPSEDSLGGLTLRRAVATGHSVWLQSMSQGTKTRCNELIFKKLAPEKPDETYLRGDPTTKLWVEKIDVPQDGPNRGKITSITTIRTVDATIFDDGQGRDPATIVAGGPGILETRPARDKPVERRAIWRDQLVMQNELASDHTPRKRITLTGDPKFIDVGQATLDSKKEIIVWLKPKPETAATVTAPAPAPVPATATATAATTGPATQSGNGAFQMEKLRATDDVHLTSPGRFMTADDELVALFETQTTPATGVGRPASSPATAPAASPAIATIRADAGTSGSDPNPATAVAATDPQAKAKPAEPDVNVRAQRVWARIALKPDAEQGGALASRAAADGNGQGQGGDDAKTEIREVRLRGAVAFHQDPEAGKQRGTTITGEAVDVTNLGDEKMYFKVYLVDPFKVMPIEPGTKVSPEKVLAMIKALGNSVPLARVETDDFSVEGPIIGLDQRADEAWVDGRGTLTQMAARGLLTDKGLDNPPAGRVQTQGQGQGQGQNQARAKAGAGAGADEKLTPLKITWTKAMQFRGRSSNPQGVPVGRAQFFANVRAEMEDSLLVCQEMTTYMDRVVVLARPKPEKTAANGNGNGNPNEAVPPEPKPQIALIDCLRKVLIVSRKYDPDSPRTLVQKQRIEGEHVIYNKLTGNFVVPGAGRVWLYSRKGQDSLATPVAAPPVPATTAARRTITPTANPTSRVAPNARRATEVVGRNTDASKAIDAATSKAASAVAKAKAKPKAEEPPPIPLELTQVVFNDEMHGRFGTGKDADTTETRWADFFGDVQTLHSVVPNESATFDFDNPPDESTFLTAQTVRVVSEPPPPGSKDPARSFLKAWENANAATYDTTIQADKITYDSLKELFYAYGEDGRDVLINQQKSIGQGATFARGSAAWYNRKSGESQIVEPKTIQLVDMKTGVRPSPITPKDPKKTYPKPLYQVRPPTQSYYERKGFNGGQ